MSKYAHNAYDIAVVGGGMVGLTASLAFAQLGLKVVVVESTLPNSSNSQAFDQRAVALSDSSVRIYQSLNLWALLADKACPIEKIHVSEQGNLGITRLDAQAHQLSAFGQVITLEQAGPTLWEACQAVENIDLLCPATVIGVEQTDQSAELKLADHQPVTVKLVVAADGTFSKMAQLCNLPIERRAYEQQAIIANVITQNPHNNQAFERFTPTGPLALLPLVKHQLGLVWCQSQAQATQRMALNDSDFCQELQDEFGYRLGTIQQVSKRQTYPLSLHIAQSHSTGRVVLLGNSAHTLHPIAGQGLNLALRDVAALNDCLFECLVNKTDIGASDKLKHYQQDRQQDWQQTVAATDGLVHLFTQPLLLAKCIRAKAMHWLNHIPVAQNYLAQSAMGTQLRASRLSRGIKNQPINN